MEFYPAHTSYQIVKRMGFRTFMKMNGHYHEPFSSNDNTSIMYVGNNELEVSEIDEELGIKVDVLYYVLPNEKTGTLVRQVVLSHVWIYCQIQFCWDINFPTKFESLAETEYPKLRKNPAGFCYPRGI